MNRIKAFDRSVLADNIVSMKTVTSRELSRKPSLISKIKPGESVDVTDRKGGLVLMRPKTQTVTAEDMDAELLRLTAGCAPMDALALEDSQ